MSSYELEGVVAENNRMVQHNLSRSLEGGVVRRASSYEVWTFCTAFSNYRSTLRTMHYIFSDNVRTARTQLVCLPSFLRCCSVQGSHMCECLEKMPVVSRADCTTYSSQGLVACEDNDLRTHYENEMRSPGGRITFNLVETCDNEDER